MVTENNSFYPQPIFEGAEKRLEVDFEPAPLSGVHEVMDVECHGAAQPHSDSEDSQSSSSATAVAGSLRAIKHGEWNKLLEPAQCSIVSWESNASCDAYLLSESSLFVYDRSLVLKTCGRTKILDAIPGILERALDGQCSSLTVARARYSRSAFKCPEQQPVPHTDFALEVSALNGLFGHLEGGGHAYVLGDQCTDALWHVYTAGAPPKGRGSTSTLEVCMTGLDPKYCEYFACKSDSNSPAQRACLRLECGLAKLLGKQDRVDDYVFDPCGYSMNAIRDERLVTIHITPEEGFSYASVEVSNLGPKDTLDASEFVGHVAALFGPQRVYVAATGDFLPAQYGGFGLAGGYSSVSCADQRVAGYGSCSFRAFATGQGGPLARGSGALAGLKGSAREPSSPVTVLGEERGASVEFSSSTSEGNDGTAAIRDPSDVDSLFIKRVSAETIESSCCVEEFAAAKIKQLSLEDTFYVFDLGNVYRRMLTWKRLLPRVRPFYAVKCNPDPGVLSTLAALGTGFDCASEVELQSVLSLGVRPDSVVYANACKRPSDLRHMKHTGTQLTTFDSESELYKIKQYHPEASCVLRIRADDPNARCFLGNKYGAEQREVEPLLAKASELGLRVVGVSFHVGSGASDPEAFRMAISLARGCFDAALRLGINTLNLLDIGGGFSGGSGDGREALESVAAVINESLDEHFGADLGTLRVIAEPGRYFSEGACTLFTCVYGKRQRENRQEYWLTDGLYGSMNCVIYDHAELKPRPLWIRSANSSATEGHPTTLFGPTCDGLDTVLKEVTMPKMENGDWVVFPQMGAYTISAASNFNGISACDPQIFYVVSKRE